MRCHQWLAYRVASCDIWNHACDHTTEPWSWMSVSRADALVAWLLCSAQWSRCAGFRESVDFGARERGKAHVVPGTATSSATQRLHSVCVVQATATHGTFFFITRTQKVHYAGLFLCPGARFGCLVYLSGNFSPLVVTGIVYK